MSACTEYVPAGMSLMLSSGKPMAEPSRVTVLPGFAPSRSRPKISCPDTPSLIWNRGSLVASLAIITNNRPSIAPAPAGKATLNLSAAPWARGDDVVVMSALAIALARVPARMMRRMAECRSGRVPSPAAEEIQPPIRRRLDTDCAASSVGAGHSPASRVPRPPESASNRCVICGWLIWPAGQAMPSRWSRCAGRRSLYSLGASSRPSCRRGAVAIR